MSSRSLAAEVVAVGSELLLGDAVDTNSATISARLAEIGVDVYRHTTVGDNLARLGEVIEGASARAGAVIVTGGLGPTQDDLTRDAISVLAGVELERSEALVEYIEGYFAARGREVTASNLRQADIPAGARVLDPVGTAAGFAADIGQATVYCLPGVPWEMIALLDRDVVPELARRAGAGITVSRWVRTAGMGESAVADMAADLVRRLDAVGNPTVAFLASRGETRVRVTGKADTRAAALQLVDPVVDELVSLLGAGVAGVDDEGVEHAVARQLNAAGWTLAVAESVTGGRVGGRLVGVAGASSWFRGALVTYATDAKTSLAGLDAQMLAGAGPVSERTSGELARNAAVRFDADVGLGVTGVAGPDTQGGLEPGTICLAVALPDGSTPARTVELPSRGRDVVLEFAASAAIDFLRRRLANAAAPGW